MNILIYDAVKYNDKIWCVPASINTLVAIDENTLEVTEYMNEVISGISESDCIHSIEIFKDCIYMLPQKKNSIIVFEIHNKKSYEIKLEIAREGKVNYYGMKMVGEQLYIFGYEIPMIVCFNIINKTIKYFDLSNYDINREKEGYFRNQQIVLKDKKLLVPFANMDALLNINTENNEIDIVRITEKLDGYTGICLEGENIWLTKNGIGEIVKLDYEYRVIEQYQFSCITKKRIFEAIICWENDIYIFPEKHNNIYQRIDGFNMLEKDYYFVHNIGKEYITYSNSDGFVIYGKQEKIIGIPHFDLERINNNSLKYIQYENDIYSLQEYINVI